MTPILSFIFIIFLIVVVHELGHLLAAKWAGMRADRFQVGFGPPILRLGRWNETEFSIGPFPLGGFVAIHGMEPKDYPPEERAFVDQPLSKRMITIAAGPFMSIVLALVLFMVVGTVFGLGEFVKPPRIGEVVEGKVADLAGIRPGDRILRAGVVPVTEWAEVSAVIHESAGLPVYLILERAGKTFSLVVFPESDLVPELTDPLRPTKRSVGRIFCTPQITRTRVGLTDSVKIAVQHSYMNVQLLFGTLFSSRVTQDIGGPLAIAGLSGKAAKRGFADLLELTGQLSLTIGIINLFPIPVLDGGHLMLYTIEWFRRGKKLSPRMQLGLQYAGLLILLALFVLVTTLDIGRMIRGETP